MCYSDHKRKHSERNRPENPVNTIACNVEQNGINHQPLEPHYEMVGLDCSQISNPTWQSNANPYDLDKREENDNQITQNSNSPTTAVEGETQMTTSYSVMPKIPEQETAVPRVYVSMKRSTRNNEEQRCASNTKPYVTMARSQPESAYTSAICVNEEYNRNRHDEYEFMSPLPPVSSLNDNESRNSACCSSPSFRFDNVAHHSAIASSGHSISKENTVRENLAANPVYVNLDIGPTRLNTEANIDHCRSKKSGIRNDSSYENMTNRIRQNSNDKDVIVRMFWK